MDKKHGYGVADWPDGRKYEGFWSDGQQHGQGKLTIPPNGKSRVGIWKEGRHIKWYTSTVQKVDMDADNEALIHEAAPQQIED
jgi:hypothetical protein